MRAWILVGVIATAGCLSGHPAEGVDADPATEQAIALGRCTERGGEFRMDADAFDNALPEGFTAVRDETGVNAKAQFTVLSCESDELMAGYIPVVAPAELQDPSIGAYRVSEGGYVESPRLMHAFVDAGMAAGFWATSIDVQEATQAALAEGQVDAEGELGSLHIEWKRPALPEDGAPTRIRTFVVDATGLPLSRMGILGSYDEEWSSRAPTAPGFAMLGSDPVTGLSGVPVVSSDVTVSLTFHPLAAP